MKPNLFEAAVATSQLSAGEPLEPLYMGIYAGGVTLLNGETGKGKTSLLYNILKAATTPDFPLWGVPFTRPQKVLALDPENSDSIRHARVERIGFGKENDRLYWHNSETVNLKDKSHVKQLCAYLLENQFTGVSIDPIARLFQTANENDNAEANLEMGHLLYIARETGCWCFCVHHTGKGAGDNYGRGASARLGAAHVGMTYRARSDDPDEINDDWGVEIERSPFIARLQVIKDRFEGSTKSLFLRSCANGVPDTFERVAFEDYMAKGVKADGSFDSGLSAFDKAAGVITTILNGEHRYVPGGELKATARASGVSESAFKSALARLVEQGSVMKKDLGKNNEKAFALQAYVRMMEDMTSVDHQKPLGI